MVPSGETAPRALADADIRNADGQFVVPSIAAVTAAAAGAAARLPATTDYRLSIVNAKGKGAYRSPPSPG